LETGKLNWRVRGWTDANFAIMGDMIVGIRGDGFLALARPTNQSMVVQAGARVVQDRVWAPPIVTGKTILIRGRNTLTSVDPDRLPRIDKMPVGSSIDSMKAMYGQQHEAVVSLLENAKRNPTGLRFDDYLSITRDRSIRFGEGQYQSLLGALGEAKAADGLALQIAQDWVDREPESIVAFDRMIELLRAKEPGLARAKENERLVQIEIDVTVPDSTPEDAQVFMAGNAGSLGSWKPNEFLLMRAEDGHYRATLLVPTGNLEFKFTLGSWESVEVREAGRSMSNRRQRVSKPMTIQAKVQDWKILERP
jgi:hypothetical protein